MSVNFFLLVIVISVAVTNAEEDAVGEAFSSAFGNYDQNLQNALDGNGGGPISDYLNVFNRIAKCIDKEVGNIDLCKFETSYDPFYYLQKCAKGTLVQKVIEKFVKSIPHLGIMGGIPQKVSKDRCFKTLPSILPNIFGKF